MLLKGKEYSAADRPHIFTLIRHFYKISSSLLNMLSRKLRKQQLPKIKENTSSHFLSLLIVSSLLVD